MMDKGKICVVGTGHIGLPLAAVLAEVGFEVTGYDTNDDFVSGVNTTGVAGFREDGLDDLLAKHLHKGLTLTSSPPAGQDVYIITVGTPLDPGTGDPISTASRSPFSASRLDSGRTRSSSFEAP